ncbi:MAG: hypothetical protein V3T43_06195 [Nitrosomonadaceae bacterium]
MTHEKWKIEVNRKIEEVELIVESLQETILNLTLISPSLEKTLKKKLMTLKEEKKSWNWISALLLGFILGFASLVALAFIFSYV